MANVIINDTNLKNIGNAIREKNGGEILYKPSEMADAILAIEGGGGGGYVPTDEELTYDLSEGYPFGGGFNAWILKEYGNNIIFKGYNSGSGIFDKYPYEVFDANIKFTNTQYLYLGNAFENADKLKTITGSFDTSNLTSVELRVINNMFASCMNLRDINDNLLDATKVYWNVSSGTANGRMHQLFSGCYSLREVPEFIFKVLTTNGTANPKISNANYGYVNMFNYCHTLNKIENLPVIESMVSGSKISNNTCSYIVNNCFNLSKFTFATNPDGTPIVANWNNQTIDMTQNVGYAGDNYYYTNVYNYNSGLTAADRIDAPTTTSIPAREYSTYEKMTSKWTRDASMSKYGHDEAVETINSLPDTSAAGGGNTIKFRGGQGYYTNHLKNRTGTSNMVEPSSISKLTDAEIAVATAKGWTVTIA